MNLKFFRINFLRNLFLIFLLLCLFKVHKVYALDMNKNNSKQIIEELRIEVPNGFKDEWLKAEKEIWDPWLKNKDGFLGRKIFWNKESDQGLVILKWESKEKWKNIPNDEVNLVQNIFEKRVKEALNINYNPFKLIYEGELYEQY